MPQTKFFEERNPKRSKSSNHLEHDTTTLFTDMLEATTNILQGIKDGDKAKIEGSRYALQVAYAEFEKAPLEAREELMKSVLQGMEASEENAQAFQFLADCLDKLNQTVSQHDPAESANLSNRA
jgi:hypothetical protein